MLVVYYYKDDCAPCQRVKPLLDRLAEEHGFRLQRVNVSKVSKSYLFTMDVQSVPAVIVFESGKYKGRLGGPFITENTLRKMIKG